jgi:hypothetical protein
MTIEEYGEQLWKKTSSSSNGGHGSTGMVEAQKSLPFFSFMASAVM